MLIPRFSLRSLLVVTTLAALVSMIASYAVQGHHWAIGVIAGLAIMMSNLLFSGAMFFVIWFLGRLAGFRPLNVAAKTPSASPS